MKTRIRKIARFTLRWGVAIVGIWWVISQMSFADRALVVGADNRPVEVKVIDDLPDGRYVIQSPGTKERQEVGSHELVNAPDRKTVVLQDGSQTRVVPLLGMDLVTGTNGVVTAERLLVASGPKGEGAWILPLQVSGGFKLKVPHPKVEVGLESMVRDANRWLLVLSVVIFPITILLTSVRWQRLLHALSIEITLWQTTVLNWVGLFYNTFIPMGSTGGDLLKAYYVAQHTPHKARAVMSVFVDRIVGLLVLVMIGGAAGTVYFAMATNYDDPAVRACWQIATGSAAIVGGGMICLLVALHPRVRLLLQSEKLLSRLPMRTHILSIFEVMAIYRQHPVLMLWAGVVTIPVHLTVVVSAMLAGKAFGLPISSGYYFIVVPVTVLAGAIPISPQGAGVMEFFAINLTARQGATISQAFALTMSIRMVQIIWNLVGGVFVISGHYRAPADRNAVAELTPLTGEG